MTKRITFSAMLLALTVICLYGASALSTGRLAALALASLFVAVSVYQYGVRTGVTLYVAASLLSLLLVPKRMYVSVYILFVGYYPIVKLYIERLRKLWAEWILKILAFNTALAALYFVFRAFFMPSVSPAVLTLLVQYAGLILLGLELAFIVYDVALSYMIGFYDRFLRRIHHE